MKTPDRSDILLHKQFNIKWFPSIPIILLTICLLLTPSLSATTEITEQPIKTAKPSFTLNIDCEQTSGLINHFSEINCGPLPNPTITGVDLSNQFRKIGLDFVRTHDFNGPTDISMIFPNMSKDPTVAANYNFTLSDIYISSIINAGCNVFYRLGESASTDELLRQPPNNITKWAEICKHITMHYNDGWADGFHYNITHWEIWNEPDLSGFWNGTTEQYYELYQVTAETLKSYNISLKIGGPCTSSIFNQNYTVGFLSFVKENQIPLDFYSWHMYADNPFQLFNGSKLVRNLLDSFGFIQTENINTEWNYNILSPQRDKDNAKNAAFTTCSLTAFQDSGIDYAFRYRATQDNNPITRFIGFDLSLFSAEGLFKIPALSYLALNNMVSDSPIRLENTSSFAKKSITSLAGISEDKTNISLLLSNFNTDDTEYEINVNNLPWNNSYTVIYYLIDDDHHLQIVNQTEHNGRLIQLNNVLKQSTVHFIRITNASVIPEEGPVTADIPFLLQLPFLDPLAKLFGFILMLVFFG